MRKGYRRQGEPRGRNRNNAINPIPIHNSSQVYPIEREEDEFPNQTVSFLNEGHCGYPFCQPCARAPSITARVVRVDAACSASGFQAGHSCEGQNACCGYNFLLAIRGATFFFVFQRVVQFRRYSSGRLKRPIRSLPLRVQRREVTIIVNASFVRFRR